MAQATNRMLNQAIINILIAGALAVVPALFWGYIFYKKQPENKLTAAHLFLSGMITVTPLLAYKYLWQFFPWINAFAYTNTFQDNLVGFSNIAVIPLDVVATFMIVGVIEEIAKFTAVRIIHHKKINSVTDCIEYFIIVALGFAFAENMIYFYNIMQVRGTDSILLPFVFRSLFSTFAHVMFSGVLGYYYGLATFARPMMDETENQDKWPILRAISSVFHLNKTRTFHDEKILQGLGIAIALHAFFNIFLEMNWTFLIIPYLTIGFIVLSYMFDSRSLDKEYANIDK